MKTFIYKTAQIILILLVLSTVAFAFYQSLLPMEQSTEQSNKVGEIIEEIIPPDTKPGEYVQKNLRKLAHFTEFFFLGLWSSLYVMIFARKVRNALLVLPFGIMIGLLDETVQIFSKRGSSVTDVWIDSLGYATAFVFVLFFSLSVFVIRHIARIRAGRISL